MTTATRKPGRPALPAEAFEHGDVRRYHRGCRCHPCTRAATIRSRTNTYLRATGRGAMRSPEQAARHIEHLRTAGMSDTAIMRAANITRDALYRTLRGTGRIHARTEQRILAVPVPQRSGPTQSCARIPATGTVRRIQALAAAGWYIAEIGHRLGLPRQCLDGLANGRGGSYVTRNFADRVQALYADLNNKRPEDHGVAPRRAHRARAIAAAKGWPDPTFWEDYGGIDDPAAPETEEQEKREEAARTLAADIRHLASFGVAEEEIARRVGRSRSYVHAQIVGIRGPGWRQQQEVA